VVCVCSIISVITASYYSEVNLHGFMELFKFCGTWEFTLHLALDGAYHGGTKCGYKCEDIIDLSTIIWSHDINVFVINYVFVVRYFMQVARTKFCVLQ
jgi:hypothetical protein